MTSCQLPLSLPTPVRLLTSEASGELWVKDDGRITSMYGGNKPRKLEKLLALAAQRGKKRLLTVGAVGSHHVLATAILGRAAGFDTTALVVPRPYSSHAEQTTRETLGAGMQLLPLGCASDLPRAIACLLRPGSFWIPPGGSNALGALGYLEAVLELEAQVRQGELPEPDLIVVALGSFGTASGILAGLGCSSLSSRLVAVPVLRLPVSRWMVQRLAQRTLRLGGYARRDLSRRLEIDGRWVGEGYGHSTHEAEKAIEIAADYGLRLESTYTGKAFAAALEWLRGSEDRGNVRVLFWSTISSTSPDTPTDTLPPIPAQLARLLVRK